MKQNSHRQRSGNNILLTVLTVTTLCWPSMASWADTVQTEDGRVWKGLVVDETARELKLDLGFDVAALDKNHIIRIQRSNPKEAAAIRNDLEIKRQRYEKVMRQRDGKPQEVPLINFNGHVLVDVLLEGHVKARVLLDTGSTITFLSANIAKQLGLPAKGSKPTIEAMTSDGRKQRMALVTLQSVRIGNIETQGVQVAILPQTKDQLPYVDGLLGVSFLSQYNFKIDYRRNKLILERNYTSSPVLVTQTAAR